MNPDPKPNHFPEQPITTPTTPPLQDPGEGDRAGQPNPPKRMY